MNIYKSILTLCALLDSLCWCQKFEKFYVVDSRVKPVKGDNITFICKGVGDAIAWQHKRHSISSSTDKHSFETKKDGNKVESFLRVVNLTANDSGKYKCVLKKGEQQDIKNISVYVQVPPTIEEVSDYIGKVGTDALLVCKASATPQPQIKWFKNNEEIASNDRYLMEEKSDSRHYASDLIIKSIIPEDNGTYACQFTNAHGAITGSPLLLVQGAPVVKLTLARSVGLNKVELEWMTNHNNAPINDTKVMIHLPNNERKSIDVSSDSDSVLLEGAALKLGAADDENVLKNFQVSVVVQNEIGTHESDRFNVTMMQKDPEFIPVTSIRGSTKDSLSVSWTQPTDEKLSNLIDFYRLTLRESETEKNVEGDDKKEAEESVIVEELPNDVTNQLFENLKHGTLYVFMIEACMVHAKKCGKTSEVVSGRTLSEPPKSVTDVVVDCVSNRTSGENFVKVQWQPPKNHRSVDKYRIALKASAHYINELGRTDYYDSLTVKFTDADKRQYIFYSVHPNTNYTVKVYAGTRNVFSSALSSNCETPVWLPNARNWRWWKSQSHKRIVLKMPTPRVSQRNGTICCYRIIVVPLKANVSVNELPSPADIPLYSYAYVQSSNVFSGYVAETFIGPEVKSKYVVVGDDKRISNLTQQCIKCIGEEAAIPPNPFPASLATPSREGNNSLFLNSLLNLVQYDSENSFPVIAEDRFLTREDNYTGFLVMSVRDKDGEVMSSYSDYFNVIQPTLDHNPHTSINPSYSQSLTNVVYILGVLIIFLILMSAALGFLLCHFHQKRKQLLEDGTDDSIPGSLGRFFRTLKRSHTLMSQPGLDIPPIPKERLVPDYQEKIKDSELGFRREFEALPEKFYDRSSRASEQTENSSKNRYPDIRAHDQTRVKLNPIPGVSGSDYINANFVMGYKERKKFICAQGPMESTVNDFWRMIVEQRSSLCIMLTNLQENGKLKCVKYWPEAGEPKKFGAITVRLVKEKVYADYIVRTLRAEWTVTNQENIPIENGVITNGNATTKSNSSVANSISASGGEKGSSGNILAASGRKTGAPGNLLGRKRRSSENVLSASGGKKGSSGNIVESTTADEPHKNSLNRIDSISSEETKCHEVQQYHYLMWKDFVAPEHPVGLLSFLRRINEAYSPDLGPLLVHCSAGVGRTGTLVALDIMVQELDEENQASIYNTICDLRHQRNFLVQSLKQYVFVHRALMEHAQFGNSELSMATLRENYNKHMQENTPENPSLIQQEFERLSKVIEDRKAFTVAHSDANKSKNRYDYVLPYDTNCVILMPIVNKPTATYINASFMAGFDMGENFIVTQDPLENTVSDFWRMIYENQVKTIVMLSELGGGEDRCSNYWPETEINHEHISVKFVCSESYPKYTTRSFLVSNSKTGDSVNVTQFQYVGWSGNVGEVPLVTYGIMEVICRVQGHNDALHADLSNDCLPHQPPTVIHCSGGGDRSSVFVCLNNSLRQLRRENCVDVFQTARKIRSQRQFQIQELSQYEFIYKALVEYIEMRKGENL